MNALVKTYISYMLFEKCTFNAIRYVGSKLCRTEVRKHLVDVISLNSSAIVLS